MRYVFLLISLLTVSCSSRQSCRLQNGDLLFQTDGNGLSGAIQEVTQSVEGYAFSHVAMAVVDSGGRLQVIEAIGCGVRLTPADSFLQRAVTVIARVKPEYRALLPAAVDFAVKQTGLPYDNEYLYDNGKYYCSELLYDAFLVANGGRPFFALEPMTFKSPATGEFSAGWTQHYEQLGIPIPEGEPGCNPGGLSRSEKIEIIEVIKP